MSLQTVHKMLLLDLQKFQTDFCYVNTAAEEECKDRKIYPFLYSLEHFLSNSSKISFLISYGILIHNFLENTVEDSHDHIGTQILFAMHYLTKSHIRHELIIWVDFNIYPLWHGKGIPLFSPQQLSKHFLFCDENTDVPVNSDD